MLAAIRNGRLTAAWQIGDDDPHGTCPHCLAPVFLKRGIEVVWHFAHYANSTCPWSEESDEHAGAKMTLARLFTDEGYRVEPEVSVGSRKVDLRVEGGTRWCAVEVQRSNIQTSTMFERERAHAAHGALATVWVWVDRSEIGPDMRFCWYRDWVSLNLLDRGKPALALFRHSGDGQVAASEQVAATPQLVVCRARGGRPGVRFGVELERSSSAAWPIPLDQF